MFYGNAPLLLSRRERMGLFSGRMKNQHPQAIRKKMNDIGLTSAPVFFVLEKNSFCIVLRQQLAVIGYKDQYYAKD
jgi:hypothetical protein